MIKNRKDREANNNPWYVMMTLFGEQTCLNFDKSIHEQNRKYWNAWVCKDFSNEKRKKIAEECSISLEELKSWNSIKEDFKLRFTHRISGASIPTDNFSVLLSNTIFKEPVCASKFIFPPLTQLWGSSFEKMVDFSGAIFLGHAWFYKVKYGGNVDFMNSKFQKGAVFSEAIFCKAVDFSMSIFDGEAIFLATNFKFNADFHKTVFKGAAEFLQANFESKTNFNQTIFQVKSNFNSTKFKGVTRFLEVDFYGTVIFKSVEFGEISFFYDSIFHSSANFNNTIYKKTASFKDSTFNDPLYFTNAIFNTSEEDDYIAFSSCLFRKIVNFNGSKFMFKYPIMEGTSFVEGVNFSANDDNWPSDEIINRLDEKGKKLAKTTCSYIRHSFGKNGHPEEEHKFYRKEMRLASKIGTFKKRLPYIFFRYFSEYGYSIRLPILWLLVLWLVPSGLYFFGVPIIGQEGLSWTGIGASGIGLSLSNIFRFAGFHNQIFDNDFIIRLPSYFKVLSVVQTLCSIPLLFLLGLGLRNRFRLR